MESEGQRCTEMERKKGQRETERGGGGEMMLGSDNQPAKPQNIHLSLLSSVSSQLQEPLIRDTNRQWCYT